jgi:hypothetical protein
MSQAAPAITRSPADVVRMTPVSQAANGVCYATAGESSIGSFDLERMIAAVPAKIASALKRKAYYFVPLTVSQGEEILIADRYDVALSDNAVCHRNLKAGRGGNAGRDLARCVGSSKAGYYGRAGRRAIQERILRGNVRRHDLDLPAFPVSGCRLLRSEGAGLSPAGAFGAGRTITESGGVIPGKSGI